MNKKTKQLNLYIDEKNRVIIATIDHKEPVIAHFPDNIETFDRMKIADLTIVIRKIFPHLYPYDPMELYVHQSGQISRDLIIGLIDGRLTIEPQKTAVYSDRIERQPA